MNQLDFPILSLMVGLPLIGALLCLVWPGKGEDKAQMARVLALATTLGTFALGVLLWLTYEIGGPQWQFVENYPIFGRFAWALGIDGIALMLIMLSVFLMPICIIASWQSIKTRVPEYMAAFLLMESLMIGVFTAQDIFLFYIFFEAGLIPMYLIIGIWGGQDRIYASYKFFLYTLLGSVLMLIAMLWMVQEAGTSDIPSLMAYDFPAGIQNWLWLAFFASFAVKVPMVPVHLWLPEAHVEAPTAGSVILAGILLKLGTYGFLRFSIPLFPAATLYFTPLVMTMSVVAILYASLTTLRQIDLKKIIAYSSVAHMNFVTLGLFSLNTQGVEGSLLLMVSHGIVSPALFLAIGVLYDRHKTRLLRYYGGCARGMPLFALVFLFFTMANISVPGTSSFVGEFLVLLGAYQHSPLVTLLASVGMVLGAAYGLWLCNRLLYGQVKVQYLPVMADLNRRELWMCLPCMALVLWMGFYPEPFLDTMHCSVSHLLVQGVSFL